jgi:hypothetical protein
VIKMGENPYFGKAAGRLLRDAEREEARRKHGPNPRGAPTRTGRTIRSLN